MSCCLQEGGVAALRVKGRFAFDAATHRDFLGACLGTGIDRSKVGDIIVLGEEGAQILVVPELVDHLETSLLQVWPTSSKTETRGPSLRRTLAFYVEAWWEKAIVL